MGVIVLGKEKRIDGCDLSDYLETFRNSKHLDVPVEIISSPGSFSQVLIMQQRSETKPINE